MVIPLFYSYGASSYGSKAFPPPQAMMALSLRNSRFQGIAFYPAKGCFPLCFKDLPDGLSFLLFYSRKSRS